MDRGGLWEGTTRAEDAQGIPTQSHISPSILVYEEKTHEVGEGGEAHEAPQRLEVHHLGVGFERVR